MLRLSPFVISAAAILLAAPASAQLPSAQLPSVQLPSAQQKPIAGGTLQCGEFDPPAQPSLPGPVFSGALKCLFTPSRNGGAQQVYAVRPQFARGPLVREPVRLEWNVVAGIPAAPTFLAGGYSSGLEDIPIASNLDGNLLVGGNENLIVLQPRQIPLSPGQPAGAPNLAANVSVLELQFLACRPDSDAC